MGIPGACFARDNVRVVRVRPNNFQSNNCIVLSVLKKQLKSVESVSPHETNLYCYVLNLFTINKYIPLLLFYS